jgi:hypothetical protein
MQVRGHAEELVAFWNATTASSLGRSGIAASQRFVR